MVDAAFFSKSSKTNINKIESQLQKTEYIIPKIKSKKKLLKELRSFCGR
jgi:hypothetical protein